MHSRRGEQLSPLHFDPEIERTARRIRARRRSNIMSFSQVSSSPVSVAQEPSGEATGMSFIPPVSEFQFGSTVASGGTVSAPAPIPSCTLPSVPPFTPVSQPQSTNPFTSAMSWGVPTCEGTPVNGQQTSTSHLISQPQPVLFKPQPTFQPITQPLQYQQPPQQHYYYPEAEERYDEEDGGWVSPQQPWDRGRGPPRREQQHQHLQVSLVGNNSRRNFYKNSIQSAKPRKSGAQSKSFNKSQEWLSMKRLIG
ncbi:hypothetical protein L1887_28712 [Cichorium endivia]|nr:hypothetical protein L1887_28712 [Cichorium endivia]